MSEHRRAYSFKSECYLILNKLFGAETIRIEEDTINIINQNDELYKSSMRGFLYEGKAYRDFSYLGKDWTEIPELHESLKDQFKIVIDNKRIHDNKNRAVERYFTEAENLIHSPAGAVVVLPECIHKYLESADGNLSKRPSFEQEKIRATGNVNIWDFKELPSTKEAEQIIKEIMTKKLILGDD